MKCRRINYSTNILKILVLTLIILPISEIFSSNVKFYSVNTMYGTLEREVYSICKDDNGFIWAASKTGILRVSENDSRLYNLPVTIKDFYFIRLIYKNSKLIAFTSNGQIFIYNELYDRFDLFLDIKQALNDANANILGLVVDKNGTLWIGSTKGLYKYSNQELTLAFDSKAEVQQVDLYKDHNLILATINGIGIFNTQSQKLEYIYKYSAVNEIQVSSFCYDTEFNQIWIGTISNGLFLYPIEGKKLTEIIKDELPKQPILAIRKKQESSVLIGIDGQGICEVSRDGTKILNIYKEDVNDPFSLQGDGVYDIFCDKDERVWIATFTGGLSFFNQKLSDINIINHQINNPNSLVNNNVNKVLEDKKGDIWFATNNGLSRWNVKSNHWCRYIHDKKNAAKVFLALCEDDEGNIWAGTYSSGVYVINGNTGKEINHYFHDRDKTGFSGQFISDIFKDMDGNIWMGGTRNIICHQKKENKFRVYESQPINSFSELSSDIILLACTYGLVSLKKDTGKFEVLINNYHLQDIIVLEDNIWITTSGEGLLCYDYKNKTIEKYSTESGILSNYINSITYVNGYLWLGTEAGLCQFDINKKKAFTSPSLLSLSRVSFNTNAHFSMKNGNIIWGTNKGGVITNPYILYKNEIEGKIFFQNISISGRSIREYENLLKKNPVNEQASLDLNHKQNNFILELLPLGMYTKDIKFSWKMEGLDLKWSHPSNLRLVTYNSLPSGNYKLSIRMYDSSLSKIIDERSLDIEVFPPFWETWWFRLIIIMVISGVIVYLIKSYSSHLKQKHIKDKIQFFTNMAHDIRTSLTLISAPIEQLNNARGLPANLRYYSNLASEQSNRLSSVATQLLDFEKVDLGKGQIFLVMTDIVNLLSKRILIFEEASKKKNIKLNFSFNQSTYFTAIDELKIEKVVDNLISNAIKYSHLNGRIDIMLDCNKCSWSLEVKDYGLGISSKAQKLLFREFYRGDNVVNSRMVGSGIGLLLVKSYVDLHKGQIILNSKENIGSSFTIAIPYKRVEIEKTVSNHFVQEDRSESILQPKIETEQSVSEEKGYERSKKMQILVVEDNNELQDFLKNSLQELYNISVANDGEVAWNLINKKMPDLIISDIMMPNMDGFGLCQLIKSTFQTSHIPVILLTALSDKTKQLEGLGLGADDYITKPFDITVLIKRIESILKNREIVRERTLKMINATRDKENVFANELNDRFIKKALDIVRKNIDNSEFGKDEFASAMNVSPSLLYQKMKNLTGQSPIEFIKAIRFNYASELLQSGNYSITEVSEMCGFSSANYFSTAFRKYFGKAPTEY